MITVDLAQRLKRAGMNWQPAERDFFMIPDRNLDGQVFVVSQLPSLVQVLGGEPTVTFHGSIEWALDSVLLTEVVWLPSESQLRQAIVELIGPDAPLRLERARAGYRCQIAYRADMLEFVAESAEDAYAQTLLHLLKARWVS
jgi:hypothetical protein